MIANNRAASWLVCLHNELSLNRDFRLGVAVVAEGVKSRVERIAGGMMK